MKKRVITKVLLLSTLSPVVACFSANLSSCSNFSDEVKSIDGTNWEGIRAGSFEPEDYVIDLITGTVTYTCGIAFHTYNLKIPNYVEYNGKRLKVNLGQGCFANNNGLTGIVELNDFIEEIPAYCFAQCYSLTGVVFHKYPKKIGDLAFYRCNIFVKILVKSGDVLDPYWTIELEKVGSYAFFNCWLQNELVFGQNLTSIGEYAFAGCFEVPLIDLSFSTKITTISTGAFNRCSNCDSVELPPNLATIEPMAFKDCTNLEYVVLPKKNMHIKLGDYAFRECSNLHTFSQPFIIDEMGVGVFSYDTQLNLPIWEKQYGEKRIPAHAFTSCAMGSVIFDPTAIDDIGDYAFAECKELTVLDFSYFSPQEVPQWTGYHIFEGINDSGTVYLSSTSSISQEWRDFFEENDIDITKWNIREKTPSVRQVIEPDNKDAEIITDIHPKVENTEFPGFEIDMSTDEVDINKLTVDFQYDKEQYRDLNFEFSWTPERKNGFKRYTLMVKVSKSGDWSECVVSGPMSFYYNGLKVPSKDSTFNIHIHVVE